jgi:hypothetical protein
MASTLMVALYSRRNCSIDLSGVNGFARFAAMIAYNAGLAMALIPFDLFQGFE